MKLTLSAFLLSLVMSIPVSAHNDVHWSYEGKGSPEHWGELSEKFETCAKGQFQSPINIHDVVDGKLPPLKLDFHAETESIVNNGHTIQITVNDGDDFVLDNDKFELKQFHFHTPSENHIFDKVFPLEAHFVHANDKGELAVIAVMFEIGKENDTLNTILHAVPEKIDETLPLKKSVDLSPLFPADKGYYRFSGSLTTPPCSEGLRWLVMKTPLTLSEAQLSSFKKLLKHTNNRPFQPLHGRVVVE